MSCARSAPLPELPITAHVMLSRVVSADVPPRPSDCAIETLTAMPTQPYRELGTIQISAAEPDRQDTRVIIDQHACAMGADAVLMNPAAASRDGLVEATAIAYASGIADRVAKARAAEEAAASPPPIPKSPVPEVEKITPAGSPQSLPAAADESEEELPPQTLVPIRELQIGPAEAPSPTPRATPSVTPVTPTAMRASAASASPAIKLLTTTAPAPPPASSILTPVPIPAQALPPASTATPSPIPAPSPSSSPIATPTPSAMLTPIAIPAVAKSPPASGSAGPAAMPLSLFRIVPDEDLGASPPASASPSASPSP